MKNILKIWLKKDQQTVDPTEYNAQVVIKGNINTTDIPLNIKDVCVPVLFNQFPDPR